jgi:glycosyltransferase involved in cell wall biosynthesis
VNIIQITPGAGAMFCGNCFRDNALVAALRKQGSEVLMVPLYLPLTLDEPDQTQGTPIFFNGVNVYLEQKSSWFRTAPPWVHRLTASPGLLKWAAGRAAGTRAADVGDITISMIRGEEGHQARELEELIVFLKTQRRPDIICLSNVLLVGLARRLKAELGAKIVCVLQGEDSFLDALPDDVRFLAWKTLAERCADIDLFIPPTRYFGERMLERLKLPAEKVKVIYDGINLHGYEGYQGPRSKADSVEVPTLGFFARMCREKGLATVVEAFMLLRERKQVPELKLKIGGGYGASDEPFVNELRGRLHTKGLLQEVEFHPNVDRDGKLAFLRSLSVFSVPALYGEAFGLYVIEAMASGVPVVQPRHAAFPELIEMSGGGVLYEPADAAALADAIEPLLLDAARARALGEAGRKAVGEKFNVNAMARETLRVYEELLGRRKLVATGGRAA